MTSEWGNQFADSLAGEVWVGDPIHYQINPCAPIMPHAQSLQVQLPDGTISGKIKQNFPPTINTEIGLQQLVRYVDYFEDQMEFIDWASFQTIHVNVTLMSPCKQKLQKLMIYKSYFDRERTDTVSNSTD